MKPVYWMLVAELLRRHIPQAQVWAYGSRVHGGGHAASDLDLVVRWPESLARGSLSALRAALTESPLPIRVDILDWADLPVSFQREIEKAYVIVQKSVQ